MSALTGSPAWQALTAHHAEIKDVHLRTLFAEDPGRAERFSAEAADLFLDYSKNRITDETLRLLQALADKRGVAKRRDAMFAGDKINATKRLAVLHVALRAPRGAHMEVDGIDVVLDVHAVLDAMAGFAIGLRQFLDSRFGPISDPAALPHALEAQAGLVGHGLILGITSDVIVAGEAGVRHFRRKYSAVG